VLLNLILTPLAICFPDDLHENKNTNFSWLALELVLNLLWAFNFVINMNRVDPILKIFTFRESLNAYLRGWMIPDAIALITSTSSILANKLILAKWFDLIRVLHFQSSLYPVYLCILKTNKSG